MAPELYPSAQRQRPRRASANWPVFWALVALLVAAPLAWLYLDPTPGGGRARTETVVVRPGEGWSEVTERLRARGLVRRPLTFKAIVLVSGARSELLPGRYSLRSGTGSRDLIAALTSAERGSSVTIPEGFRVEQVGERLVARGLATGKEWEAALRKRRTSPVLASRPTGAGLEGYLYPDTYGFTEENAAEQFVSAAVANLDDRLTPQLRRDLEREAGSVHKGLTLASIVEREAQSAPERPVIASVYLNRLRLPGGPMRLQADPTVQYAVGRPGAWWKQGLTLADLRAPSPYNTYVHAGLPPGPIANPGIASIRAVARPASTPYLYFVAKGDGAHAFAETLEEHDANVRRYLGR